MKQFLGFILTLVILSLPAGAITIYVPGSYPTIQAGVNAAANGDTVLVAPGTYSEQVIIQNAVIHLLSSEGADVTTIYVSGTGSSRCLIIHNNSEVGGFQLLRTAAYWSNAALEVMGGSPFIHHNLIRSGSEGPTSVKISGAGSPNFLNNSVYAYDDIADFQYGFHISNASATPTLKNNIVVCEGADFGPEYTVYNQAGAAINHTYNDFWTPFGSGLQGITMGPGEISANPLWSTFHLQFNSPCVDTGVPIMLDPDFTVSDMGYRYYNQGTPAVNLALTLTPQTLPIVIPASGGSFNYDIAISNPDSLTVPTDIWSKVTIPGGTLFGPLWGPLNYNLPPFFNQSRSKVQSVPASAPAGAYVFHIFIGLYPAVIWDHQTIPFSKLATDEEKPANP